ncbi:hypothetical protein DXG01_002968 [Tephrocybe rancida]|nr:hypothetical protein DXG01_002968 [Tephrocybe rancida]
MVYRPSLLYILLVSTPIYVASQQASVEQIAAQYGLTTSTILPFPSATQSSTDTESLLVSSWSLGKGRIQDDPNNLAFVADPFPKNPTPIPSGSDTTGPVLEATYPANSFGSADSGAQFINLWNTTDGSSFQTMLVSYEVAFASGFDWVKGGKLPGLRGGLNSTGCSGGNQSDGKDCFSTRLMWRKDGEGEDFGISLQRGSFGFVSGQWNRITMLVRLNDPPNVANGNVQLYYNDLKAIDQQNLQIRSSSSVTANGFYFSTFFGGSDDSWKTPTETHTYFRNIRLYAGSAASNLTGKAVSAADRTTTTIATPLLLLIVIGHTNPNAHLDQTMPYPPVPPTLERDQSSSSTAPLSHGERPPQVVFGGNAERGPPPEGLPYHSKSRNSSWDLLAGIKRLEHSYEEFDMRNASQAHLVYADGDIPKSKLVRFYNYLLNVSIVTRWILLIVPVLALLWIPGILSLTAYPKATIWGVRLLWWSVWLSVAWGGWWAALAISFIMPPVLRSTIGIVAVGTRKYIEWMHVLHRQGPGTGDKSVKASDTAARLLFAFFLCSGVLLFEKFSIQWIAGKFHERSYAERIADQKFAVRSLVTLYRNSTDIPGRLDTLRDGPTKRGSVNPKRFFKKFREGVRMAATTTTTALGNVASEIAGSSVLQPNSPQAMVKTALESANKSRLLARRLFYSFAKPGAEYLLVDDLARYFEVPGEADHVFSLFDKDMNGDASRDEVEMACLEIHREQLSIENSMQDLDSAVGRLDNILISVYVIVAILIIAVALEAQLATLITGAGTLILGLSWLIGGSLQEVLTSIIFLFVKHPFDVGDRVCVAKENYTVKEIRLLSTVFLDSNSTLVQAPNTVLNTMFVQNIRRSPQMSETFTFDVSYATTFEDLEKLRDKMLGFVKTERRDYQPAFDVVVKDFPAQEKMTLAADIKYKSNWQQGSLKANRRNKWICALKTALAELNIYGPSGNPDAKSPTMRYTQVPYEEFKAKEQQEAETSFPQPSGLPPSGWQLADNNGILVDESNNIFGETNELYMTNPRNLSEGPGGNLRQRPPAPSMPIPGTVSSGSRRIDDIEMATRH